MKQMKLSLRKDNLKRKRKIPSMSYKHSQPNPTKLLFNQLTIHINPHTCHPLHFIHLPCLTSLNHIRSTMFHTPDPIHQPCLYLAKQLSRTTKQLSLPQSLYKCHPESTTSLTRQQRIVLFPTFI